MYLHEKPLITQIRGYKDNPRGYEEKVPYDFILTVQYIGDDTVYLEGLHGTMTKDLLKALKAYAKERGVRYLRYNRNTTSSRDITIEVG